MSSKPRPIRAITFDFWMTLFRDANGPERQALRIKALREASGCTEVQARAAFTFAARQFQDYHLRYHRTLDTLDAVRMTGVYLGASFDAPTEQHLAQVYADAIVPHGPVPVEGALEAVRAAAERGSVGILSDTGLSPGRSLRQLLDKHGFTPYFAALVFSDETGCAKPHHRAFEVATRRLGVHPAELLHIGDWEHTDIAGARAVGSRSVRFFGVVDHADRTTQADAALENWGAFPELLRRLV